MHTVISAFDDRQTAQLAVDRLVASGFSRDDVHLQSGSDSSSDLSGSDNPSMTSMTSMSPSSSTASSSSGTPRSDRDEGFFAKVGDFFGNLFDSDDSSSNAGTYSEAVRRGSAVVVVDVANDAEAERATDILEELGAIDIDERASAWKAEGWSGSNTSSGGANLTSSGADMTTAMNTASVAPTAATSASTVSEQPTALNVVQEELKVGKRTVDTGKVRVIQRVTQTPVRELVRLREERATIERRPVDRPATEADFSAFKDGTIEVRETSEEAVVGKTARVVEEVVVGKEVQERTETIDDTVRRTDVEIERVEGRTDGVTGNQPVTGTGTVLDTDDLAKRRKL